MDIARLDFNEHRARLRRLAEEAEFIGHTELGRCWRWIAQCTSSQQVGRAIANRWAGSTFARLREWSTRITSASVLVRANGDDYGTAPTPTLLLGVDQSGGLRVEQAPPLQREDALALLPALPPAAAALIVELLSVAPGLSLGWVPGYGGGGDAVLCAPHFFHSPMAYIDLWLKSYFARYEKAGITPDRVPDAGGCVCEVLHTVIGDSYLLRGDDSLMFFGHEEVEFLPVEVDLRRLIEIYLEDSERILEPAGLGSV